MFYDRFVYLCQQRGVTPTRAALDAGISKSLVSKWKVNNAKDPSPDILRRLAKYFGISIAELLGDAQTPAALNERDRRDIARSLESLMAQLDSSNDLMFDGDPMSDEARESIRAAMRLGLEAAKVKNKERFTPNKYKKG